MAITSIKPQWKGRGGTTDEKGVRTLKRAWIVTTDSDADGEPQVIDGVIATDASAALYASHPNWAQALCRKLSADPHEGPRVWMVTAEYSSAAFAGERGNGVPGDGSGTTGNPATPSAANSNSTPADQRAPTISIARKEVTEPLEFHMGTSDPVLNTAGDPFAPPVEVFRSRHVITWKFFRTPAQLNWNYRSQWQDTINEDAVTILGREYEPHSLRCTAYDLDTVWETGPSGLAFFFALTVQAEYKPDLWDVLVLNTGRRKVVYEDDIAIGTFEIVDGNGQPVSDPVPLDINGEPLAPGGTPVYVEAVGYLDYPWLGAGSTLTGAGGLLE